MNSFDFTYKLGENPQTLFARGVEACDLSEAIEVLKKYWSDNVHNIHSIRPLANNTNEANF